MSTFKDEIVEISKEASTPDPHDYDILMHNLQRRIRNAAKRGEFFSVIDTLSRSLYRDGSNSVRGSAIRETMKKVTDELVSMGFHVEVTANNSMRIHWK